MRGWGSKICLLLLPVIVLALPARASHIVGGEVSYKCLGNNKYEITINIYEDCQTGYQEAIQQDDPGLISIYDGSDFRHLVLFDSIRLNPQIHVPANFSNQCVNNYPTVCLLKSSFIKTYSLSASTTGYLIVYQRCCRNSTVLNIVNPGITGATYYTNIPPSQQAACNNSAVFKNYPPQIICLNTPLIYDHSATDADGDSLSYEFCTAYQGGSENQVKPRPAPPPYQPVQYLSPFTATNPMGGFPQIKIDPVTGLITGTPNIVGRFVVTVCCHEWRNGQMINTVFRDFQFVVTNCSKAVVADIPILSDEPNTYIIQCDGYTVHFVNKSSGGNTYHWDFGVPGATSTEFEPTYTYPDTGTYTVKLIVNPGSTCADSITRLVKVYPSFKTNYSLSGLHCPGSPINFTDLTESTYKPIVSWLWNFGDGQSSTQQNPVHAFSSGNNYNVSLISENVKGCTDTATQDVYIENFKPFAGDDTIIVAGEKINFNATGGLHYLWTPGTNLNAIDIPNPIGTYPDTGHFAYNVYIKSETGCEGNDSIKVWVVGQASYFVPNAFTPNNDGINDVLRPIAIGYSANNYFRIFNRFGELVYTSKDFSEGWNGTYKGQLADMGTYFWELSITNRFGKKEFYKGDVTLIR
jgi:gliding motility-associated-like protein